MTTVQRTIACDAEGIAEIGRVVDGLAQAYRLPLAAVADMQVALDQVLANIVSHAHAGGATHDIRVRLTVSSDALEAEVEDDGRPFDALSAPAPDVHAPSAS